MRIVARRGILPGKFGRGVLEVRQKDVDVAFQLGYDLGALIAARVVDDGELQNVWLELPRKICGEVIGIEQTPRTCEVKGLHDLGDEMRRRHEVDVERATCLLFEEDLRKALD